MYIQMWLIICFDIKLWLFSDLSFCVLILAVNQYNIFGFVTLYAYCISFFSFVTLFKRHNFKSDFMSYHILLGYGVFSVIHKLNMMFYLQTELIPFFVKALHV